jgi:hypothetical protein
MIERLLPKSIHSVTPQGFELKVGLFVLAASLNFLWKQLGLNKGFRISLRFFQPE